MTNIGSSEDERADETSFFMASRELFWRSRYLRDASGLEHLPFVFWLVGELRPRRAVTLNMGEGVLHFGLCQAVDKSGYDTLCHGFGNWHAEGAAHIPPTLTAYNSDHYQDFSSLIADDVEGSALRFRNASVDLLIVEEPLDAAGLEALASLWIPLLSDHGVVLLSGIDQLGVDAAKRLHLLQDGYPHVRFLHASGLLVLLVGSTAPANLQRMTGGGRDHPDYLTFHRFMARLGSLHAREWSAMKQANATKDLTTSLKAAKQEAATLHKNMATFREAFDLRQNRCAQLEAESFDLRRRITELSSEIDEARSELVTLRSSAPVMEEIRALTEKLESVEERRLSLVETLKKAENRIATRDKRIKELEASTSWRITAPVRKLALWMR